MRLWSNEDETTYKMYKYKITRRISQPQFKLAYGLDKVTNQSKSRHLFSIWAEMRGSDGVFVPLELLEELGILLHSF